MKKAIFLFLFCPLVLFGQKKVSQGPKNLPPEPWMIGQVKHVSQFIDRFDYQKLPDGTAFTDSTRQLYPREQYIRALFNQEDTRLTKHKVNKYTLLVEEFLEPIRQNDSI